MCFGKYGLAWLVALAAATVVAVPAAPELGGPGAPWFSMLLASLGTLLVDRTGQWGFEKAGFGQANVFEVKTGHALLFEDFGPEVDTGAPGGPGGPGSNCEELYREGVDVFL